MVLELSVNLVSLLDLLLRNFCEEPHLYSAESLMSMSFGFHLFSRSGRASQIDLGHDVHACPSLVTQTTPTSTTTAECTKAGPVERQRRR